jgi:hypothetical protein
VIWTGIRLGGLVSSGASEIGGVDQALPGGGDSGAWSPSNSAVLTAEL